MFCITDISRIFVKEITTKTIEIMKSKTKNFGELTIGTVVNYTNLVIGENVDYVVLQQYTDKWGNYTKVLNKETNEIDSFTQETLIYQRWSIIKEN